MICEELEKEITSESCSNMKKHGWCERSCEQKPLPKNGNGGNVKSPQNNPEIIDQPSQISTITPELAQSTEEENKTIVGHPGKAKGKILGTCGKRSNELLTWTACNQRRRKKIDICRECDQSPFQFSQPPKGRGWANSAARAIEVDCPDLGRKVKLPSCRMKQGKLVRAGKTCDIACEHWKGEKKVEQKTVIWCAECSKIMVEHIGELCYLCTRNLVKKQEHAKRNPLFAMWCPTCQKEKTGIPGSHCGECESELHDPQQWPDSSPNQLHAIAPAKPNHVKLVAIPNNLLTFLKMADQYTKDLACLQKNIEYNNARIVIELQKAVKEERS